MKIYVLAASVAPEKAQALLHDIDRGNTKVARAERELIEQGILRRNMGVIHYLEMARARQNDLLCGLIRIVMQEAPREARAIFKKIEANDAKILALSAHLRG